MKSNTVGQWSSLYYKLKLNVVVEVGSARFQATVLLQKTLHEAAAVKLRPQLRNQGVVTGDVICDAHRERGCLQLLLYFRFRRVHSCNDRFVRSFQFLLPWELIEVVLGSLDVCSYQCSLLLLSDHISPHQLTSSEPWAWQCHISHMYSHQLWTL